MGYNDSMTDTDRNKETSSQVQEATEQETKAPEVDADGVPIVPSVYGFNSSEEGDEQSTSDESDEGGDATETKADSADAKATVERAETESDTLAATATGERELSTQDSDSSDGTESAEQAALNIKELANILSKGEEPPEGVDEQILEAARDRIRLETAERQLAVLKEKVIGNPYDSLSEDQQNEIEQTRATEGNGAAYLLEKKYCDEVVRNAMEGDSKVREEAVKQERVQTLSDAAKQFGITTGDFDNYIPKALANELTAKVKNGELTFKEASLRGAKAAAELKARFTGVKQVKQTKSQVAPKLIDVSKGNKRGNVSDDKSNIPNLGEAEKMFGFGADGRPIRRQ